MGKNREDVNSWVFIKNILVPDGKKEWLRHVMGEESE